MSQRQLLIGVQDEPAAPRRSTDEQSRMGQDFVSQARRHSWVAGTLAALVVLGLAPLAREILVKGCAEALAEPIKKGAHRTIQYLGSLFTHKETADSPHDSVAMTERDHNAARSDARDSGRESTTSAANTQPVPPQAPKRLGWVVVVTSARSEQALAEMQSTIESIARECSRTLSRKLQILRAQARNGWWGALAVNPNGATYDEAIDTAKCFDGYADIQGPCFPKEAAFYCLP
jgi:hypothetical protein